MAVRRGETRTYGKQSGNEADHRSNSTLLCYVSDVDNDSNPKYSSMISTAYLTNTPANL
ncbi:MAG: hypothetical protein K2H01_09260 [Ruminococcus sp.]|nr:hypothetical protein [Ruminococcus sp.]